MDEELRKINAYRRVRLFFSILYIILAALTGAGGFAGITVFAIVRLNPEWLSYLFLGLSMVIFLGGVPSFTLLAIRQGTLYKKRFSETYLVPAGEELYEGFSYKFNDKEKAADLAKVAATLLRKDPDIDASSYYEGTYGGSRFSSFAYACMGWRSRHYGNLAMSEEVERTGKAFGKYQAGTVDLGGRFFLFELGKEFPAPVFLRDKRHPGFFKRPRKDWKPFKGESIKFNDMYDCFYAGKDLEHAFLAIDPAFLGGVISLEEDYGGCLSLYVEGKRALVYFDHYDSGFKISLTRKVSKNTLYYLKRELELPRCLLKTVGSF